MRKQQKYNVADTNIAFLGSDLEKKVRLTAAQTEQAWRGAGSAVGTQIWRIEKFQVVAWPPKSYGSFYNGDSYIVLHTYKRRADSDALAWDIHFWLGAYTTQDEAGTAAYKTVELDDFLGGAPTQHREVQGFESPRFRSYFPRLAYLQGGVESGFRHVEGPQYARRLLHVKGTRRCIVTKEVDASPSKMNAGDAFVLDLGERIFQWNGREAGADEKMKANLLCRALRDEREQSVQLCTLEQGVDDDPTRSTEAKQFWAAIAGDATTPSAAADAVRPARDGGDDEAVQSDKALFRLTDGRAPPRKTTNLQPAYVARQQAAAAAAAAAGEFSAHDDATALAAALKKTIGKDTDALIAVLGTRSYEQRMAVQRTYPDVRGKKHELFADIEKKTTFEPGLRLVCRLLLSSPLELDVYALRKALTAKLGTNYAVLIEVLAHAPADHVAEIVRAYDARYGPNAPAHADNQKKKKKKAVKAGAGLAADLDKATRRHLAHGDTNRLLAELVRCARQKNDVDSDVAADAKLLFKAHEDKLLGTDQDTFVKVFTQRSHTHLAKVALAYVEQSKKHHTLDHVVHKIGGEFGVALDAILSRAMRTSVEFRARRLIAAMKGLGTNDLSLVRTLVESSNKGDLSQVAAAFQQQNNYETLTNWVSDDTSAEFKDMLLTLIGSEPLLSPRRQKPDAADSRDADVEEVDLDCSAALAARRFRFDLVARSTVPRSALDSDDVFIFDIGFQIYVWIGKNSSAGERKKGLQYAQYYLGKARKPLHTPISRVLEGGENEVFELNFDAEPSSS